jgi:protein involved in polysaccharide export with SLBB domain
MKFRVLLVIWALGWLSFSVMGQLPANLSNVKSSQLSNDQLLTLIKQGEASGQSPEDVLRELKSRGLPDAEIAELSNRVTDLSRQQTSKDETTPSSNSKNARKVSPIDKLEGQKNVPKSLVFGAELFSEASSIFVPNLTIATPPNYKVGPGDELLLEVYGTNVFTQKIVVSREGFINVKYAGLINANGVAIQDLNEIVRGKLSKYIPALAGGGARSQLSLGSIRSITVSVVGAVKKPGTLTLPSLATLFNALYATGGPMENGSLRKIELIRGNKKLLEADLYDFLLKGDQSANIFLQDNDLIRVPFADRQVRLTGLLNRTGIFEVTAKDNLNDLLFFAGGFKPNAYRGRLKGSRNGELIKEVIDIESSSFNDFTFSNGDSLHVDSLVEKYSNRVTIEGAVYKPGVYSWIKGQKLSDLISKAAGLRGDAYLTRATVLRTYPNLKKESFSVNLGEQLSSESNFELLSEDSVKIYSVDSLRNRFTVSINGAVKNPGSYPYADSLTLQQLILLAGGFTDQAIPTGIEIGRRSPASDLSVNTELGKVSIISVALTADLKIGNDVTLQPQDIVTIKADPKRKAQAVVQLSGSVYYPGSYVLENRQDRLSDLIKRGGGLLPYADINGARLIRKNLLKDTASVKEVLNKQSVVKKLALTDSLQSQDLNKDLSVDEIALDLQRALANPNSIDDILIEDGDEIVIPQRKDVITVAGAVLKPVSVQFISRKNLRYYVSSAGGYSDRAKKAKSYVVFTNGQSKRTKLYLGLFRNHPSLLPGSTVYIPERPIKDNKFDATKAGVLVSAISALLTTIAILRQ